MVRREQMDGDTEMTEETAVRIAEALESIDSAIRLIGALVISFGLVYFAYAIMAKWGK